MVAPVMVTTPLPGVAVSVAAPHVVTAFEGVATRRFAGSVSVNAMPLQFTSWVLVSVIVRVDGTPRARVTGLNALVTLIPPTVRFTVGDTAPAAGVCVVVTPEVVLGCTPGVVPVTTIVMVQLPPAGIVIAVKLNAVAPLASAAGKVPTQVPPTACAPDTDMLVSVSVKAAPVTAANAFGLVTVKVSVDGPPAAIVAGAKAFAMVGGSKTWIVAVSVAPLNCAGAVPVTVFDFRPELVPFTSRETVQVA